MTDTTSARGRPDRRRGAARSVVWLGLLAGLVATLSLTGCMERFFYLPTREATPAPSWLEPRSEAVWFVSADGTRLRGWFVPARDGRPRDAATVLHVHGNAGSMNGHLAFVDHLPAAGFNLFMFDYRGYGESLGSPRSRAALLEDAKAALRTVAARPDVDPARIALFGHSLGGGIAVLLAADVVDPRFGPGPAADPDSGAALGSEAVASPLPAIRSLVLESPISGWREAAATALGGDPPSTWSRWLAVLLVYDTVPGAGRPFEEIARVDVPILIVHGSADRIVPDSHGRRLAAAAPAAELVIAEGGDHNTLQRTHPEIRRAVVEFLRATTGPRP